MSRFFAALLASLSFVTLANPAAAADAANGEKLATLWCAACHVVTTTQRHGSTQAAPFSEIAKEPGIDAAKIALYLLLPHPKMPDMNLSRSEAADLAAYIETQGR